MAEPPARSAFAAAFLSLLFPGLGHAYLRRWSRALFWAALPLVVMAAVAGLAVGPSRSDLVTNLADPVALDILLGLLVVDAAYRLLAMLDAYRCATDVTVGSRPTRVLSMAGLATLVVALVSSHAVAAQPILLVTDLVHGIAENVGDESEIADLDELARTDDDFVLRLAPAPPEVDGGATPAPVTPEPKAPEWDGRRRLDILLIGADGGRQGGSTYLTDTLITVSIDPKSGRIAFISLPRDASAIPLPKSWPAHRALGGTYNNKINTLYTMARGRPDLFPGNDRERGYIALMGALSELYGLDIKYYVAVDLDSFRHLVNLLGGAIVDVQLPVHDDGYPSDDGRGKLKLYVPAGMTRMNGQQALAYARSRHGSSDFDRSARQQRVVTSVRDQTDIEDLLRPGVLSGLVDQIKQDIRTNVPPRELPGLLSLAQRIDLDGRRSLVLSPPTYATECYPCPPDGLYLLTADVAAIRKATKNVLKRRGA